MDPNQPRFTANYASEFKMPSGIKNLAVIAFFIIFVMIFWVWLSSPMIVTVTGTGEVSVPASYATVSFGLTSSDASAQSAVSAVKQKAENIRSFLMTSGISSEDIAESQVTAVPAGLVTQGGTGFQATIQMAAKTIHIPNVATLVSDLYVNGVEVVSQPVLSVENEDKLEDEAFNMAMKDAKSQASKIGFRNWKFIKKIVGVSQASSSNTSTATTKADVLTETSSTTATDNGVFKIVKVVSVIYKFW